MEGRWLNILDTRWLVQSVADECTGLVIGDDDHRRIINLAARHMYINVLRDYWDGDENSVDPKILSAYGCLGGIAMFLKTGPRTEIAAARGDIPALEQCGRIPDSVFMFIGLLDNEHAFSVFDWAYSRGYIFGKSVITILLYSADARVLELVTEHMYDDIVEDE